MYCELFEAHFKLKFKILSFIFVVYVMISTTYSIEDCEHIFKDQSLYECYDKNITYNSSINQSINWIIINTSFGLVEVEYNHPGIYNKIELSVLENNPDKNSCNANLTGYWQEHSFYNYTRLIKENENLPKCDQGVKVKFQYIFTGCYRIEICSVPVQDNSNCENYTKYLHTDYVKYIFDQNNITAEHQQRNSDKKTSLITKLDNPLHSESIELCFKLVNSIYETKRLWSVSCPLIYDKMISNCNITVYTGNKKIICMSRKQIKNSTIFSIECSLFELSPGAYHFEKYITNEPVRCHTSDNSVWGSQPCIWNHSLTLTEEKILSQDKTQRRSNHSGLWLIAGIYSVLIVIVVLFMFCINNNLIIRHNVEQDDDSSDKELVEDSSILVLYAKDCVLFMEAMKQFRKILQAEGNYQIFDIHDPERVPDMLKDTQSFWLLNRIKDKKTKIILVTSKCGDFLIRNQESAFKLYKNPSCKDFMYKYAVHILLQDVHSYSYNKLFVLKFNFVEESSSTSCLNQNQRYSLDVYDNVRLLMHDIFKNHDCFEENTTMFKEYVRFDEKCKMLVNYVRDNPDYLSDIFQTT